MSMSTHFPGGSYRRRIRLVATGLGEVEAGLEDDFHHFEVTIRCDDEQVTDVEGRALRWPWTTCPDAAVPLRELEGMPLSTNCLAVGDRADPRANCTHMFDLAGLAVAHAARGGPLGTTRQYDMEIPAGAQLGGEVVVRLWRDGKPLLWWSLDGRACIAPEPYASAPWRGGFFRWAEQNLDDAAAEAAIVLRRACDIGMGRGMDLDAVDAAQEMEPLMLGVCFTMQPARIAVALREKGTVRDFDEHPERLLRD
jgi:Protein of unknown function (DUF2889)